jgi:4-amino-4-deoxy-L-arabinose transferase-like glycosyltransferase
LRSYAFAFAVIAAFLILAHGPLLRLPFFWDEAGQFIPASLDLFRAGAWIPVSTVPNIHPPGVMAYLAAVWSVFGFSIEGTRLAMLLIAAAGALLSFLLAIELSRGAPGTPAFAAIALLCLSPLFFAQSMLAQLDMPAMCFSILSLLLFLQGRIQACAIACIVLVEVKETGLVVPALFAGWLVYERRLRDALWFLLPVPPLLIWLTELHRATGYWVGNPAFGTYNLRYPLSTWHLALALFRRLYYLLVGSGHIIGTAVLVWGWRRMPLLRSRPWRVAGSFVVAQILVVSLFGGAVLERYVLPALPVVYTAFAVSLQALAPVTRRWALAGLVVCLAAANFVKPFYPFPFENNLAFVDFVALEHTVASVVESSSAGPVAAVFPVADGLRRPDLGYVDTARRVIEIPDYSQSAIEKLRAEQPEMIVVFNRDWDPLGLLAHAGFKDFAEKHFGYIPEMRAAEIASALSMRVVGQWKRQGLSMELVAR